MVASFASTQMQVAAVIPKGYWEKKENVRLKNRHEAGPVAPVKILVGLES